MLLDFVVQLVDVLLELLVDDAVVDVCVDVLGHDARTFVSFCLDLSSSRSIS